MQKSQTHCFLFKHFIALVGLESPASFSSAEMLLEEEVTINWPNYPAIDPKHTHKKQSLTCKILHIYELLYVNQHFIQISYKIKFKLSSFLKKNISLG